MKYQSLHRLFIACISVILCGFLVFISCSNSDGILGPQKISSGEWNADTDFGEFHFIVDSEGTYIETITITFDNWTIGGVTHNGSVSITRYEPKWWITGRTFYISVDLVGIHSQQAIK